MKNKLLLLLLFYIPLIAIAQKTIVDGDVDNNNVPFYNKQKYTYSESIYLQSEINEFGMITQLCLEYNGYSPINESIKIFLGHTTKNQFTSNTDWITANNMTEVYDGKIITSTNGWVCITLDVPFFYNNVDNLVVGFYDHDANDYYWNSGSYWYTKSTYNNADARYRSIYYNNDYNKPNPYNPPYASGHFYYVPSFKVTSNTNVLPANDIQLSGKSNGAVNELNWTTSSEKNTEYHVLMRAGENGVFEEISTQQAVGNSKVSSYYTATDNNAPTKSYYKIKVVDVDGETTTFSNVVVVENNKIDATINFTIYPNPTNSVANVHITSKISSNIVLNVYNALGELLKTENISYAENTIAVNLSTYVKGVYFIELLVNGNSKTKRVVKS